MNKSETLHQEVNLYLPHLRPSSDYLTAVWLGRGLVVFVCLLLLVTMADVLQNRSLQEQLQQRQVAQSQLEIQVTDMKRRLPKSQAAQLNRTILSLHAEVARRQAISRLIDGQSIGNTSGFSPYLQGLSRHISSQLSLTGFDLRRGGQQVALQGVARKAQAVPLYIEQLQADDSFYDSLFGPMIIERRDGESRLVFRLNSEAQTDFSGGK